MIKDLFVRQQKLLDFFFENIDIEKTNLILAKILQCKNTIILTGIGKSGIIANKLAMTWLSTGNKAFYLDPVAALHGDIGVVSKDDLFIIFSKSGQTGELLDLLPYVKKKGASTIAIVSHPNSILSKRCDISITLPLKKELCPYNLAPTTSTTIQLIFGDVLGIALMQQKNFSLHDYAKNHPAGSIGNKLTVYVEDIMLKNERLPLCKPHDKLIDIIHEISSKKCGALLVVNAKKKLLGIFTDGDLRRAIESKGSAFLHLKIEDLMTKKPLSTTKETLVLDAIKKMEANPSRLITVLPVLQNEEVIGLIRMHDIVQAGLSS